LTAEDIASAASVVEDKDGPSATIESDAIESEDPVESAMTEVEDESTLADEEESPMAGLGAGGPGAEGPGAGGPGAGGPGAGGPGTVGPQGPGGMA
jgi:hypothetical protein